MVGVGIRLVRNDVSGTGEEGAVVAGAQRRGKRCIMVQRYGHEGVQTSTCTGTMAAWVVGTPPMAPFFLAPSPADAITIIMIERMPEGLSPLPSRRQPKPQRLWP